MAIFLSMGGYASFIWPAWGIAALVMIAVTVRTILRAQAVKKRLASYESTAP